MDGDLHPRAFGDANIMTLYVMTMVMPSYRGTPMQYSAAWHPIAAAERLE